MLAKSPVTVVIDHYGLYGDKRPDSPEGRRLLDLVRLPHVWMKLSAPYRHDRGPLNMVPDREWIAALLEAAPDRCVWGSDWPHPPHNDDQKGANLEAPYRALSYTTLVDEFLAALPSQDCADARHERKPGAALRFLATGHRQSCRRQSMREESIK